MDKISIYVLDTRKYTYNDLLTFTKLNDEDVMFLSKFRVLEVKKEKLISYYFKKKYVGEFHLNEYGKPMSDNVYFNISHSKGVVVIAVSQNHEVGVDIELLQPKDKELVKYVCNDEEYRFVKNEVDFISIWTNKESIVKCVGTGIKNKIKDIPSLPLNGKKEYNDETFYSKIIKHGGAIISITIKDDEDFEYILKTEDMKNE